MGRFYVATQQIAYECGYFLGSLRVAAFCLAFPQSRRHIRELAVYFFRYKRCPQK
jgi:hypothetical protein